MNVVNTCIPFLKLSGGNIVLVSSVNAVTGIGEVAYSTSKAALHPYAMNLACYYGKYGVTANTIALGKYWAMFRKLFPDIKSIPLFHF